MSKSSRGGIRLVRRALSTARQPTTEPTRDDEYLYKTFRPFVDERNTLGELLPDPRSVVGPNRSSRGLRFSRRSQRSNSTFNGLQNWKKNVSKNQKPNYADYCKLQFFTLLYSSLPNR